MKKFIALALSLVMALSLSVVAWGATMTESELQNLLNADGTVTLTGNVTVENGLSVPAGVTVTLDLAGYTISQTKAQTAGYQMLENKGNLTITDSVGGGKMTYTDSGNGGEYISDTIYNRGTLVINGGTIENLSSATVASNGYPHAVDTYSGDRDTSVTINGGTIYCANYSAIRMFCVSATNKADLVINGGTIKGAIDMQNGTAAAALGSLTINDGTFETTANANNIRFANWNGGATTYGITASIDGGSFDGGITSAYVPAAANWDSKIITGGTFTDDVSAYVAAGVQQLPNGSVVPSSSIGDNTLSGNYFVKGTGAGAVASAAVVSVTDAKAPKDTDKDGLLDQVGNVKYFNIAGYTSKFVQVASVGEADMIVYYGNTDSVFAYLKAVASVEYLGTGVAFNNFGEKCGQYDDEPVADTKYYLFQGVVYKTVTTSATNLMVGNTLTPVEAMADEFVDHAPAFTYDKDYKVVGVKCAKCGVPATLYANWAAIPKAAQADALALGDGRYYVWGAIGAAGTNGDKVESAETFDAGIAMYVGMSVMAAAGSAVVLKKRED